MEVLSGKDLLETFRTLGINTGNVSQETINAWFDTDCEATKELLHWLCTSLGKENVLTAHENEEYKQLLNNEKVLSGKEYEIALSQIQSDYPGILNYESNQLEVECMEDELAMLQEEERHLEHLLEINGKLDKKLSKEIKEVNEEEIKSTIKKEAVHQKCLELSYKLDESHEKLQQQVGCYAEHLNEFEHATAPTFLSNIPTMKYDQYYSDVTSYLGILMRKEYGILPKLESTIKTARKKLHESHSVTDGVIDQLDTLRQRIFKSIHNYFYKQVKEEQLQAEIKFFQDLNLPEIMLAAPPDESLQFMLEANIFSREELFERMLLDMENVARQISDAFIDAPKIIVTEKTMNINRKKLESLTLIDNKIIEVLAKHILLYLFIKKENFDVQSTDKFFRDVHYYITHSLRNCQLRTEAMTTVINDYNLYKYLPFEQKFKFANVIKALLTDKQNNSSSITAIDAIKSFISECNNLEQRVFFHDYADYRRFLHEMEEEIGVMRKFIDNGPTNQIITIPNQLTDNFNKICELLETQESLLKSAMQMLNSAEKKLSDNKWLCVKRQLWMWFLFEPKKVLSAITQIEGAVTQKRKEAFCV